MSETLYPLKFNPIFKERIWGGNKLKSILNKSIVSEQIGESWEISDLEGDVSVVSNGVLKGKTLKSLIKEFTSDLVGINNFKIFGDKFPLLIKFIDARDDLSIQLHPNDELAKQRHDSFGKTEMWYVIQADADSNLIVGFNKKVTSDIYLKHLKEKSLPEILNYEAVAEGDTYFIDVGRVHAIGAGILLAEIQQTSDITYRVYDWDRIDAAGNSRELHNELALEAIDFNMDADYKIDYDTLENVSNKMVKCPYFTTNYLPLNSRINKSNTTGSFLIYICTEGQLTIESDRFSVSMIKGETVLMPASIKEFSLISEKAKLLEVYV